MEELVRWKIFGPQHDSWKKLGELEHARRLLEEYNDRLR